jgi:hypothetical protein
MTTLEVPVVLLIDSQDMASFLEGILQKDGRLRIVVCPWCFATVPNQKLPDHAEALKH